MAREIDLDDMSDEDLHYISQRSWLVQEAFRVHGVDLKPRINELLYKQKNIPPGPGQVWTTDSANEGVGEIEEIEDYDQWTKDALVKEVQARNVDLSEDSKMSTSGTKAQLVAALRADDVAAASAE